MRSIDSAGCDPPFFPGPDSDGNVRIARAQQTRRTKLNEQYLERAKNKYEDVRVLINGASRRATDLARGARPLVPVLPQDNRSYLDIALLEIAEGKIVISVVTDDDDTDDE